MSKSARAKEALKDIIAVIGACTSSPWFWLPVLFCLFLYVELYLLILNFYVSLIGPITLILSALYIEERRSKNNPLLAKPLKIRSQEEDDKLLDDYKKMLNKKDQ